MSTRKYNIKIKEKFKLTLDTEAVKSYTLMFIIDTD